MLPHPGKTGVRPSRLNLLVTDGRIEVVNPRAVARWSPGVRALALLLALIAESALAEDVAVRVREDGRVDVRVRAAPLTAVLDRLGSQTGMKVTYGKPLPRRVVSLAVSGSDHAQAVLELLEGVGVDYAVTTNSEGTRILSVVVADRVEPGPSSPGDAKQGEESAPTPLDDAMEPADAGDVGDAGSNASSAEGFPLLPGDFIPGSRATGQTTEWGMPEFVLPEPSPSPSPNASNGAEPRPAPTPGADP